MILLSERTREEFNRKEWRLDEIPKHSLIVKCFNAFDLFNILLYACFILLDLFLILPALRRVIRRMEIADENGRMSKILCNEKARHDYKVRLLTFRNDLLQSESILPFCKVMNYTAAYKSITAYDHFLFLGEEASDEIVRTPIFISSLPRTGSTILHRTMARDNERWRVFTFADQLITTSPPVPSDDVEGKSKIIQLSKKIMKSMEVFYPGWRKCNDSVHPLIEHEANENHPWYGPALGFPFFAYMFLLDLDEVGQTRARKSSGRQPIFDNPEIASISYAFLFLIMQVYQHAESKANNTGDEEGEGKPYRPWMVKDTWDSLYLPQLIEQFPDAKLIFTHRKPNKVVSSCTKLIATGVSYQFIPGAPFSTYEELRHMLWRRLSLMSERLSTFTKERDGTDLGLSTLNSGTSTRRLDAMFEEVVRDIPGFLDTVYERFFPELDGPTPEAKAKFRDYLLENSEKNISSHGKRNDDICLKEELSFTEYNNFFLRSAQ